MSTPVTPPNPEPSKDAGTEEIQHDIERTREELGQTVEALASKLDVKTQARNQAAAAKARAGDAVAAARHWITDAAASARGQFQAASQKASHRAPGDDGQRKPLLIAACAVAGAVITIVVARARARSVKMHSAVIAVAPVKVKSAGLPVGQRSPARAGLDRRTGFNTAGRMQLRKSSQQVAAKRGQKR